MSTLKPIRSVGKSYSARIEFPAGRQRNNTIQTFKIRSGAPMLEVPAEFEIDSMDQSENLNNTSIAIETIESIDSPLQNERNSQKIDKLILTSVETLKRMKHF